MQFLKANAGTATIVCAVLVASVFAQQSGRLKFEEIDVERINIVEKDGSLRMVISNRERQHPGSVGGKLVPRENGRPPGMIFFNHLGDEMGGLVFGENGESGHFGSLTFDKVRGDQTLGFRHLEGDNGQYHVGIEMWHQPGIPQETMLEHQRAARAIRDATEREAALQELIDRNEQTTRRLFLGKGRDDTSLLELFDIKGRARVRIVAPSEGEARMEFLDEAGETVLVIP